eukprot:TRINITY_DN29793_c0_g1_i1.p1 TRINITY_DN29793_c0_g1~~TRINITY_DN29793_c0_g1_i1.p1  ORF type:complete len:235 (+),score=8.67 TRINITY_DN29793_c0_g1_i1:180-884(+)
MAVLRERISQCLRPLPTARALQFSKKRAGVYNQCGNLKTTSAAYNGGVPHWPAESIECSDAEIHAVSDIIAPTSSARNAIRRREDLDIEMRKWEGSPISCLETATYSKVFDIALAGAKARRSWLKRHPAIFRATEAINALEPDARQKEWATLTNEADHLMRQELTAYSWDPRIIFWLYDSYHSKVAADLEKDRNNVFLRSMLNINNDLLSISGRSIDVESLARAHSSKSLPLTP